MTSIAVLDDYNGSISKLDCWQRLKHDFHIDFFDAAVSGKMVAHYEVIVTVRERTIIDNQFLDNAQNLKHLALTGRLSGQADLEALKSKGISVSYTAGSGNSPAELTLALMLAAMKRIPQQHNSIIGGHWQSGLGQDLSGKTLGVLGLGRVGSKVAAFGKLMEMNVVSWGPNAVSTNAEKLGVKRIELPELFSISDVVAICLRLSPLSHNLVSSQHLQSMKNGSLLVNTARAQIVNKDALYNEILSGRIMGAFDVFYEEPISPLDPLLKAPNVVLSPHMGYVTEEVYRTFFNQVVDNILAWKNNRPYLNALA